MRRAPALVLVAALAGCGSPGNERTGWATRADRACVATERQIAHHGAPIDLRDIDRVALRGAEDGRRLFDRIKRIPLPQSGAARARAVVDAIDRLEPRLGEFTHQSDAADLRRMLQVLKQTRPDYDRLSRAAGAAGLRECFTRRDGVAAFDALLVPIYLTRLTPALREEDERLKRMAHLRPPHDPKGLDDFYASRMRIYASVRDRLDVLTPPERAERQAERLIGVVFDLEGEGTNPLFAGEYDRMPPTFVARYERRYHRLRRQERRARRALLTALEQPAAGAAPAGAQPEATPA